MYHSFSPASRGGLAIAHKIADVYRDYPTVRVFLVGGSVSRGCADVYSDLEIGVFWEGDIPTAERRDAIARLGGELLTIDRDGRSMEHFALYEAEINGRLCRGYSLISMNHTTMLEMERTLTAVLTEYNTAPAYQELLHAVHYAIPLQGSDIVAAWNARSATFPEELAAKIVQENLSFGPWFIPESFIERDDPLILYRHFLIVEQHLLRVLLGLNRLYLPSTDFKWLDQTIARMTITPERLAPRLRFVFQTPDLAIAWQELKALMTETLDLIDLHLPLVNTHSFVAGRPEITTDWARRYWNPITPYTLLRNAGE